jgi:pimeloyl-ACP methyl ester carboxylesterase
LFTTTHTIPVDGAVLAAEFLPGDHPQAAPIVFLHAGVADSRMWDAQVAWAQPVRPTLRIDRRGFGATRVDRAKPHRPIDDLFAVLDLLDIARAHVVGCSQGGRLALDAALAAPGRVQSLTLVAPAVSGAPAAEITGPTRTLSDAIDAADAAGDIDRVNELEAHLWLDGPLSAPGRVAGEDRALFMAMNGAALRAADPGPALEPASAWQRLESVQAPTMLLWGDRDLPHLQQRCEQMAHRIAHARRVVLTDTAHLPPLEAPQRFNAELAAFLASLPRD